MRSLAVLTVVAIVLVLVAGFQPLSWEGGRRRRVAGRVVLAPTVPRAGQSLTVRASLFNLEGVPSTPLPYESRRAGDIARGLLQPTGRPNEFTATFVPLVPGRQWITIYFDGPEGRLALEAAFRVYAPGQRPKRAVPERLPLVVRLAPALQEVPRWLVPATYLVIGLLITLELGAIAWCLILTSRQQRPSALSRGK